MIGEEIWLSNFSLFHIIIEEAHDKDFGSVSLLFQEIKAAIANPVAVYQENTITDTNEHLWYIYYRSRSLRGKMICVVTRNQNDKRELWTAHIVPKIKRKHLEASDNVKRVYLKRGET